MGCILKGNSGLYSRMTVGAVLLAAGAGARLGGRPKALLELGGVPLILRQLIALSGAGVDEVVVVLGHHADAIEAAVRPFPITLARNPQPDDGQASSVRIGLKALSPKLDAIMIALAGRSKAMQAPRMTGPQTTICTQMGGENHASIRRAIGATSAPTMKMMNTAGPSALSAADRSSPHCGHFATTLRKPSNSLPRPQRGQRQASPVESTVTSGWRTGRDQRRRSRCR